MATPSGSPHPVCHARSLRRIPGFCSPDYLTIGTSIDRFSRFDKYRKSKKNRGARKEVDLVDLVDLVDKVDKVDLVDKVDKGDKGKSSDTRQSVTWSEAAT